MNGKIGEYLKFNKMITPVFIQVLFWLFAAMGVIIGLIVFIGGAANNSFVGAVAGLLFIILGPICARVWAEMVIVYFKIYEALQTIAAKKTESTPSA
jgi:hypothetical protein